MDITELPTDAATGAALALEAQKGIVSINANGNREFIALPNDNGGYDLKQITQDNAANVHLPKLVTQHVKLQTANSMADYVNSFKNEASILFADIATDTIVSIIDYHREPTMERDMPSAKSIASDTGASEPQTGQAISDLPTAALGLHKATLLLPKSLEWQIWTKSDGTLMPHIVFASFLEENSIDITEPSGAALLELCRDLQVKAGVSFNTSIRYGDAVNIEYQKGDDVSTKDNMQLPTQITLSIPVYFGEPPVQLTAFLRREISDGKLKLGYKLSRAEAARQAEFHRIVNEMQSNVNHLKTVYGTPA